MPLSPSEALLLVAFATLASAISSFAGGGGIILLPLLIFTGLSPRAANMNGTVALLPGMLASAWAYRRVLAQDKHPLKPALLIAFIGGLLGAVILLQAPAPSFGRAVPYLLALATAAFIYGTWFLKLKTDHSNDVALSWGQGLGLLVLAIYGGYWGGGIALMTMAVLALSGWKDLHAMNAAKSLFTATTNVAGVLLYALYGELHWERIFFMTIGTVLGGYWGARLMQKADVRWVRLVVAVYAVGMTVWFFWKN